MQSIDLVPPPSMIYCITEIWKGKKHQKRYVLLWFVNNHIFCFNMISIKTMISRLIGKDIKCALVCVQMIWQWYQNSEVVYTILCNAVLCYALFSAERSTASCTHLHYGSRLRGWFSVPISSLVDSEAQPESCPSLYSNFVLLQHAWSCYSGIRSKWTIQTCRAKEAIDWL